MWPALPTAVWLPSGRSKDFRKTERISSLHVNSEWGVFSPLFLSLPGVRTPQKAIGICLMTHTLEFYKGWEDVVGGLYRLSELGLGT